MGEFLWIVLRLSLWSLTLCINRGPVTAVFDDTDNEPCGGRLTATVARSYLYSPGYPGHYVSFLNCKWTIITRRGSGVIRLDSEMVDLESCSPCDDCDFLTAYDGPDISSTIIRRWCGNNKPTIYSSGPSLTLTFQTNRGGDASFSGFKLHYRQTTAAEACGSRLTALPSPQYLTSPGYPEDYPHEVTCVWEISSGERIRGILLDVDMISPPVCDNNYIKVYDGSDTEAGLLGKVCDTSVTTFTSSGHSMALEFHSDPSGHGRGFKMEYTSFKATNHTRLVADSSWEYIQTPNYPSPYPNLVDLTWVLLARFTRSIVCVETVTFDVQYSADCERDYLEMFDGSSELYTSFGRKCGFISFRHCSSGQYLFAKFHSDFSGGKSGFSIAYRYEVPRSTVGPPDTHRQTGTTAIIGSSVGTLVFIIAAMAIYWYVRKCKERRESRVRLTRHTVTGSSEPSNRADVIPTAPGADTIPPEQPFSDVIMPVAPPSYDDVIKTDLEQGDAPPSYQSLGIPLVTQNIRNNSASASSGTAYDNPVTVTLD